MNPILTTFNLISYSMIMAGTSPVPSQSQSRVMPGFEYTDANCVLLDDDGELTKMAMNIAEKSLDEVWEDENDDHWANFLKVSEI